LGRYAAQSWNFGVSWMILETTQLGKSAVFFSLGFVVIANLVVLALPGFAQQRSELEKTCKDVVLGTAYASKLPSSFEVSFAKYGDFFFKDPSDRKNIKFVTDYSANFVTKSQAGSVELSETGACGFDASEKLIAIKLKRDNIWRSPKDFQDYGKLPDLGRVVVFRKAAQISKDDPVVRRFAVIVDSKQQAWTVNCRTDEIQSETKQPLKPIAFATSVSTYICSLGASDSSLKSPTISTNGQDVTRILESNGTTVILPASYDQQKTYPAVVLLPYTGGTGLEFFEWAFQKPYRDRETNPFIVIIPPGKGSRSDYTPGSAFAATIQRYDTQVKSDLKTLIPKYKIDASRVSIGGYSLGADLAWALSLRNPQLFRGAILIDSFCSDRRPSSMNQFAKRNFRVFMIVGQKEAGEQNHPMAGVKNLLNQYKIANQYKDFPSSDHNKILNDIPSEMFMQSVDYSLATP
jgi:predicted esterase